MMFIERIEIENEGFLGGLDVSLAPGLNVLIGPRGAGKTSLIELIRYALDAGAFTTDAGRKGEQQAVATLDGGAVTVTVRDGDARWSVTRTSEGVTTTSLGSVPNCTVLAQSEVESIGVSPTGRLALIDRFLPDARAQAAQLRAAAELSAALTDELASALAELDKADEALSGSDEVEQHLIAAKAEQQALLERSTATDAERKQLENAQAELNELAQRESQLSYARAGIAELRRESTQMHGRVSELRASVSSIIEGSASIAHAQQAESLLGDASKRLDLALQALDAEIGGTSARRADLDTSSRAVRQRLDLTQDGLSQATRRVQQLEERKGQLDALRARRTEFIKRLELLRARRLEAYEDLVGQRTTRLSARQAIAHRLNLSLSPQIRVTVSPGERLDAYTSAIVASLRGSGLHHKNLAPLLAATLAPYELVDWVERSASTELADAAGVSIDRAAAIISAMREGGLSAVISSDVEDHVQLELLDGLDYKPIEHLSIGQRCTVILPILMALDGETLVVDQPEDHLDNAFITSTLISAIRRREGTAQTILSSHNANIPVLGEAAVVIVMDSDGESGRAVSVGELDAPQSVKAISEILEGGADAFAARAHFYEEGDGAN